MSTTAIQPYLFFNGQCEEALAFYREALGAKIDFVMKYNQAPDPAATQGVPPEFRDKVMHATLSLDGAIVMASDDCTGAIGKSNFAGFSLSLTLPDEAAAQRAFSALSAGGNVKLPLGKTFWSPCFGMLEDRFGIGWMISVA